MHHRVLQAFPIVLALGLALLRTPFALAGALPEDATIQGVVDRAYRDHKALRDGANADYIPALARVNPDTFGIVLVTADGRVFSAGDTDTEVSIQSISKVFTMALVIQQSGPDAIFNNMGVDATGQPFNSITAIEQYHGGEMNALVNPGAIAATSMVAGEDGAAVWANILDYYSTFAGRELSVLDDIYRSEAATNQRNQSLAMLMHAYGHIDGDPLEATDIYTRQCSVGVNTRDLAMMAATLANGGRNPLTGKTLVDAGHIPEILAVMATAGLYDDAGKWLYRTGLPAKSGVGGGLIAVSPGKFGIAVISPPLDKAGNSVRGQRAIADISGALGGNPYATRPR
ncbi:glutaminase A [Parahaliea mediterranea]|uniref:Glutaminase n=1 Tax=Parahaliea mediterranea TaxID=651086 RepID=A0A939DDC3_9GAMM|nr:glutaminase A [Parahaliea mediterranea]MBN7795969.1 glutaminase A [Parahaliea mediterranea]